VNFLALKTLGLGSSGFGPGADGGRYGYFKGEAPYPSETEHWKGEWYIQSKFHKPHLSKNPQKWLIEQVKQEIEAHLIMKTLIVYGLTTGLLQRTLIQVVNQKLAVLMLLKICLRKAQMVKK